jgi:sulfur-carrier protein
VNAAPYEIRIELPAHLRTLAKVSGEVRLPVGPVGPAGPVGKTPTLAATLDALEEAFPVLRGTVREHGTGERRAYMRVFACGRDLSFDPPEAPLPDEVIAGAEPLRIVGAIAGG